RGQSLRCLANNLKRRVDIGASGAKVCNTRTQRELAPNVRTRQVRAPATLHRIHDVRIEFVEFCIQFSSCFTHSAWRALQMLRNITEATDAQLRRGEQLEIGRLFNLLREVCSEGDVFSDCAGDT